MASLDTLSAVSTELTIGQLDDVDGGIIPVLIAFNVAIWTLNGIVWVVGD